MPQHIYFKTGDIVETQSDGYCLVLSQRQAKTSSTPLYHIWSYAKRRYLYHNQYNMAMRTNANDKTISEAQDISMKILSNETRDAGYIKGDCVEYRNTPYLILSAFRDIVGKPYYLVLNMLTNTTQYIDQSEISFRVRQSNQKSKDLANKLLISRIIMPGF